MTDQLPGDKASPPSNKDSILRAAGAFSLATLISRVLGYIRDMIIATLFGAGSMADAFFVAFRIPNLLRGLTAEGAMTASFVPVYTSTIHEKGLPGAFRLASNVLTIMAAVLLLVTILGELFAPWIVHAIAPGFTRDPKAFELTVYLTRVMMPYLLCVSLATIMMGMLNSVGRFFVPALAPALWNVAIIAFALTMSDKLAEPTLSLALGVVVGGVIQLIVQVIPLFRSGWRYHFSFTLRDQDTMRIGMMMIPATLGIAVSQINVFVDTLIASILPEGSVSFLYYGNRVAQFPLGVFGAAIGVASLPSMSREVAAHGKEKLAEIMSHALRLSLFIAIPASAGMISLAGPIANILFERGKFDIVARTGTITAIIYFSVGLAAFSGVKVVVAAFYALKDTATPTRVAIYCMLLNVALNLALMGTMAHGGLALATSIASFANMTALLFILRRRIGSIDGRRMLKSVTPMIGASIVMGVALHYYSISVYRYDAPLMWRGVSLSLAIGAGIAIYYIGMVTMGSREAISVRDRIKGKLGLAKPR